MAGFVLYLYSILLQFISRSSVSEVLLGGLSSTVLNSIVEDPQMAVRVLYKVSNASRATMYDGFLFVAPEYATCRDRDSASEGRLIGRVRWTANVEERFHRYEWIQMPMSISVQWCGPDDNEQVLPERPATRRRLGARPDSESFAPRRHLHPDGSASG